MNSVNGITSNNIAEALQLYCVNHGPRLGFNTTDIDRLHADAGTQFLSESFITWAKDNNISVKAAAPEHQHQIGLRERRLQHI
jgi:transposase InsO family protein